MTARQITPVARVEGVVAVPGDKSLSHRAVIFNSLAQGKAVVENLCPGADVLATVNCLRALGVDMALRGHTLVVKGQGALQEAEDVLQAGNSGTTMRLLAGLLAGQPFLSVITGDESLRSRPMARVAEPLRQMGAEIWGRRGDSLAPLAIRGGNLRGIRYKLPVASAQIKSAVLIAALFARGETVVEEPAPSRDHTERFLQAMGVSLKKEGPRLTLTPPHLPLQPISLRIPGDISSAAFWLVLGAVHPQARVRVEGVGVNPTRSGVLEVLKAMGARVKVLRREGGSEFEPVADIEVESSQLEGVEVGGELIPRLIDEIPVLAVAAVFARGKTIFRDAAELRVKESDRIATTVAELSRMGGAIEELPDGMIIYGGKPLKGEEVSSHGDHRLAMALAVAGAVASGKTVIDNMEVAQISYPGFWKDWEGLCYKERRP